MFLVKHNETAPERARQVAIEYIKEVMSKGSKKEIDEFNKWYNQTYGEK